MGLGFLGCPTPLMQAPIGRAGGVELALAVSAAGGLGTLGASYTPLDDLRSQVRRLRWSTRAPFCVHLILDFEQEDRVDVAVAEGAPWISFSFGMNPSLVDRAKSGGTRVLVQVTSAADATAEESPEGEDHGEHRRRHEDGGTEVDTGFALTLR